MVCVFSSGLHGLTWALRGSCLIYAWVLCEVCVGLRIFGFCVVGVLFFSACWNIPEGNTEPLSSIVSSSSKLSSKNAAGGGGAEEEGGGREGEGAVETTPDIPPKSPDSTSSSSSSKSLMLIATEFEVGVGVGVGVGAGVGAVVGVGEDTGGGAGGVEAPFVLE